MFNQPVPLATALTSKGENPSSCAFAPSLLFTQRIPIADLPYTVSTMDPYVNFKHFESKF